MFMVPRPKIHLTRFHGCLAPHYKYRNQIVPQKKMQSQLEIVTDDKIESTKKQRTSWARLLKRVFGIDISICTKCQGKMKIIAAVEDPAVIRKILNHLGLPATAPKLKSDRGPPESEQVELFNQEFSEI